MVYGQEIVQPPLWHVEEMQVAAAREKVLRELNAYEDGDVLLTGETVGEHRKELLGTHVAKKLVVV